MLSIGAGAERQALETIDRMGLRNVLVRDKPPRENERQEIRKKSQGVSPRDAQAVQEGVPGVVRVVPKVEIEPYKVLAAGTKADDVHVFGVAHQQQRLAHLEVEGRFLDKTDEERHAQVAVIGPASAATSSATGPPSGATSR